MKKLNKKTIIIAVVGVVLVAAIVVALVVGLGNKKPGMVEDTEAVTDTVAVTDEVTEDITTEEVTETEEISDTEEIPDTQEPETDDTTTQPQDTEAPVTNVNPNGVEITGEGSASQPYLEIPSGDMTVTTVSIPAGAELYYDIYRVGGMCLTLNSANAYVICDNLQYEPVNGQIYFQVPNALASDTVSFRIGNTGSAPASFKLIFTSPLGSYSNPAVIDVISDGANVTLNEGNEIGFYFKHIAQQNGVIRFYMDASVDSVFIVTNNRNSSQRTSEADAATDSQGNEYVEIEVNQGDELLINVGAIPNKRGKYPAAQITWYGIYN